jgi:hypothetical protein
MWLLRERDKGKKMGERLLSEWDWAEWIKAFERYCFSVVSLYTLCVVCVCVCVCVRVCVSSCFIFSYISQSLCSKNTWTLKKLTHTHTHTLTNSLTQSIKFSGRQKNGGIKKVNNTVNCTVYACAHANMGVGCVCLSVCLSVHQSTCVPVCYLHVRALLITIPL